MKPGGGPLVILYADDLAAARKRVEAAGGKIVKPKVIVALGNGVSRLDPGASRVDPRPTARAVDLVPEGAVVSATNSLGAHLSARRRVLHA